MTPRAAISTTISAAGLIRRELKVWDYAMLAELLIAYVDDAHASGDAKALAILERRAKAE